MGCGRALKLSLQASQLRRCTTAHTHGNGSFLLQANFNVLSTSSPINSPGGIAVTSQGPSSALALMPARMLLFAETITCRLVQSPILREPAVLRPGCTYTLSQCPSSREALAASTAGLTSSPARASGSEGSTHSCCCCCYPTRVRLAFGLLPSTALLLLLPPHLYPVGPTIRPPSPPSTTSTTAL